jgi:hypothetical protein
VKIFVSALTYGLGKQLGIRGAARAFAAQLVDDIDPRELLPAARLIRRLRDLGDLIVYHGAGTALPKARSRAAHAALESESDLWLMVDDDVETDHATLQRLITLAGTDRCSVLPCPIRGVESERHTVNVLWEGSLVTLLDGVQARKVRRGGCGLMVVARSALERVTDMHRPTLSFFDDDGVAKVALFHQAFVGNDGQQLWLNEDYSFTERLRAADVSIVAPIEGRASHDGVMINLAECASI